MNNLKSLINEIFQLTLLVLKNGIKKSNFSPEIITTLTETTKTLNYIKFYIWNRKDYPKSMLWGVWLSPE